MVQYKITTKSRKQSIVFMDLFRILHIIYREREKKHKKSIYYTGTSIVIYILS